MVLRGNFSKHSYQKRIYTIRYCFTWAGFIPTMFRAIRLIFLGLFDSVLKFTVNITVRFPMCPKYFPLGITFEFKTNLNYHFCCIRIKVIFTLQRLATVLLVTYLECRNVCALANAMSAHANSLFYYLFFIF